MSELRASRPGGLPAAFAPADGRDGAAAPAARGEGARPEAARFEIGGLLEGEESLLLGLRAFVVGDRRSPGERLIGLAAPAGAPPRAGFFNLSVAPRAEDGGYPPVRLAVPNMVVPRALMTGRDPASGEAAAITLMARPPPRRLDTLLAQAPGWGESYLRSAVLLPAAAALDALTRHGLTHRALYPGNMFCAEPGGVAILGPCFALPPAMTMPAVYLPPYAAQIRPDARGAGSIADDVYALAVTLLALHRGEVPLAGLPPEEILQRKLSLGSFAALTADGPRLPAWLGELLRPMLAADPDHRPAPALLLNPDAAASRRLAARPPRRAAHPIDIAGLSAWSARELAWLLAQHPDAAAAALRSLKVDQWLRRALGDAQLAIALEEAVRARLREPAGDTSGTAGAGDGGDSAALAVMRAVAVLDPLAGMAWRGQVFAPDGIGTALASQIPGDAVLGLVMAEGLRSFAGAHPRHARLAPMAAEAPLHRAALRQRGPGGGPGLLAFQLNAALPCTSPLLGGQAVLRLAELLPALDRAAPARPEAGRGPLDGSIACFIAARGDGALAMEVSALAEAEGDAWPLAVLRLFARLHTKLGEPPLPRLAHWLLATTGQAQNLLRGRSLREQVQATLARHADLGQIAPMLALLENPVARRADLEAAANAVAEAATLRQMRAELAAGTARRAAEAVIAGRDIAAGLGAAGACAGLLVAALG